MTDEQIFDQAIQLAEPDRNAFLIEACDFGQRVRVDALIAAHEASDSLLDTEVMLSSDETTVEDHATQTLGDFEILRELGRGGMGVVYEARQKSLNRKVALKVLSSGLGLSSRAILRFRREAEAAGRLHHTNIVPIYTTGEERDVHFYAMELIDGPSLDRVIRDLRSDELRPEEKANVEAASDDVPSWLRETALYLESRRGGGESQSKSDSASGSTISSGAGYFDTVAAMIADVADALDHAHEHGVIHRDVKPSNLLLAPDGRLSINDFGLARMLEQPGMTMTGEFVGSPLYMSPEQITAGRAPLDHRTDIYSLGATLYELLTLQPPFPGDSRDQVIANVLHKDPGSPRKLNRKVPVDLDTICMKAIEKDPDRRYQTAGQFGDDLRKYVDRHAISARRQNVFEKAGKFVRRKPALAGLILAICVSSFVVGLMERERRQERQRHAEQQRQQTLDHAMERCFELVIAGDHERALEQWEVAEKLSANPKWLAITRAFIELQGGNYSTAKDYIDQAPRCLATDCLDAILEFNLGNEESYFRLADKLATRYTPETGDDHLYLGLALTWINPQRALEHLIKAKQDLKGNQAVLIHRAYAYWQCALDGSDLEAFSQIDKAMSDIKIWLDEHKQDVHARGIQAHIFLTAANLYHDQGEDGRRTEYLRKAREASECVSTECTDAEQVSARFHYLQHIGQHEEAAQFIFEAINSDTVQAGKDFLAAYSTVCWFGLSEYEQAKQAFDKMGEEGQRYKRGYRCLVELSADNPPLNEERRRDLRNEFRGFLQGRGGNFGGFEKDWFVLRLLETNSKKETEDFLKEARKFFDSFEAPWMQSVVWKCDYLSGNITDPDDYLERTEHSKRFLAAAHHSIAIKFLASGQRDRALEHFHKCVEQGVFQFFVHQWSLAFINLLEADRPLPPWYSVDEKSTLDLEAKHR